MKGTSRKENLREEPLKEMIEENLPELQDYLEGKIRTAFIFL